jgi:hypothetical protein
MIRKEKISKARFNILLSQLRMKGEMKYTSVVTYVFLIDSRLREKRNNILQFCHELI